MKKGRKYIALLMLVVFTLTVVLGGCTDNKGAEDGNLTDNHSSNGQTSSPTAGGYPDASGGPISGGEITVGIAQDLDSSLDPHEMVAAGTAGTREVLFNIFEGLVKPDSDGNLIPAVASKVDIDGSAYTVTLREGVKFHNGDPVTVEDVVFSLNRCADASSKSTYVSAFSAVTSVEAKDERTVVIELKQPDIEFLAQLTAAIIPADYEDQASRPIGTGPFRFVSYAPQETFVMERFEDYWGDPAYLDQVNFRIYSSGETLMMALNSGAVDFCAHQSADRVAGLGNGFRVLEGSMNLVQALYLNNAVAPFDNVKVRQALSYAVDIQEIMQVLADGMGTPVGSSMYPAFTKYFDETLTNYYTYDPEKAKTLLTEAGYPGGFNMTITVPSNYTPHVDTAQVLVEQLAAVGVTAAIEQVDWNTWVSSVYSGRNFQTTVVGVDASSMTARAMLERFQSDSDKNFINFSSQQYDETYAEARASMDDAEQVVLYKKLQKILTEEAANVYLQDLCDLVVMNAKLDGYQFYPLYVLDFSKVYFTE